MKLKTLDWQAWPLGACANCLQQWRDAGLPGQRQELENGRSLVAGYCVHNEAGFYSIVEADDIVREWSIRVPILIDEWRAYVKILPGSFAAVRAAVDSTSPPGA